MRRSRWPQGSSSLGTYSITGLGHDASSKPKEEGIVSSWFRRFIKSQMMQDGSKAEYRNGQISLPLASCTAITIPRTFESCRPGARWVA